MTKDDQKIIDQLRSGNERDRKNAYNLLLKKTRRKAVGWLIKRKLQPNDAESVYYDALILLEQKVIKPEFKLTSNLAAFLMGIVRLKYLEVIGDTPPTPPPTTTLPPNGNEPDMAVLMEALEECLKKLKKDCRQIIFYFYYLKLNMKQIAERMGFSGDNAAYSAANKKNRCMKKLIQECNPHNVN